MQNVARALRHIAIALSLANLCFWSVFGRILPGSPMQFFRQAPPLPNEFLAAVVNVLLLATVSLAAYCVTQHSRRSSIRALPDWGVVIVLIVALNGLRVS